MSCNSCAKPFTLLRKEKGCPNCGFSYCSKCLNNKMFVAKIQSEAKVCAKCGSNEHKKHVEPPDAYYKRVSLTKCDSVDNPSNITMGDGNKDEEIAARLSKLKEKATNSKQHTTEEEIAQRLQKIKGEIPKTTNSELLERLAKLRGPIIIKPDLRTEQEQANDLMKQYLEETKVDTKYKDEFEGLVNAMESRLGKLKGAEGCGPSSTPAEIESEDEEEIVKKIIEKTKATVTSDSDDEDELPTTKNDELPFCEICNEDAKMRCLGCKYLFCKRCFLDHKDDDDGCNRYEPYTPPKGVNY